MHWAYIISFSVLVSQVNKLGKLRWSLLDFLESDPFYVMSPAKNLRLEHYKRLILLAAGWPTCNSFEWDDHLFFNISFIDKVEEWASSMVILSSSSQGVGSCVAMLKRKSCIIYIYIFRWKNWIDDHVLIESFTPTNCSTRFGKSVKLQKMHLSKRRILLYFGRNFVTMSH